MSEIPKLTSPAPASAPRQRKPESTHRRLYEIDLLRFVAALAVVLFHYGFRGYAADNMTAMPLLYFAPIFKYGYFGVDLFFLISGFVILMSASSGSARRFVVSRVVRLYPAFWASCTATFLAIVIAGGARFTASLHQYAVNMTMLSEFLRVKPIDEVYWSLFVEMKFYALVLAVLLIRQIGRAKELLGLWLLAVLIINQWHLPFVGFFLIPDYAPYFIAGAMLYVVHLEGVSAYKISVVAASYLVALRGALDRATEMATHYQVSFDPRVILVVLTVCFIALFLIATGWTKKLSSDKWLLVGALTYPLYLLHQRIGFIIFNLSYPLLSPYLIFAGTLSLMLVASYVINRKIERPCSKKLKPWLERQLGMLPSEEGGRLTGSP